MLLACSDYEYNKEVDPVDTGRGAPAGDSADTHDTEPVDSVPADTGDSAEPELEETYCTPFDDFSGWAYTGTGEWHVDGGLLTEGRNGGYAAIAYAADLGRASHFRVQVDTAWTGNDNDLTGIAWSVNGEQAWVARWDDPQDDYERYDPPGNMDLSWCESGGCTPSLSDSSANLYWPADKSFVTWSVEVNGSAVEVVVAGTTVLSGTVPEVLGTGPGVVGVYSNDNDGGVWFDNFCVWTAAE